jgi:hypothetical protein
MLKERGGPSPDPNAGQREQRPRPAGGRGPRLPNFLVIGAMKSGTTSLFHYLRAHPQVFMSPLKEVDFFIEGGNWGRGLDWYRRQFDGASPEAVAIGEASTSYTKYPEYEGVPERISALLPDVRLIYVVRDPIERIRSHYQHRSLIGAEPLPIDVAVLQDPRYVDCSRYALQIEQYLNHFPRERLLVVTSEALKGQRVATIGGIYRFLDVDDAYVPETVDREFYQTADRARYPAYVWWLRRSMKRYIPAGKRAKELVDLVLPGTVGRVRSGPAPTPRKSEPPIPPLLRTQLEEMLRDDVHKLRAIMPEGFDGWGIA